MKSKKELEDEYHCWITSIPDNLLVLENILANDLYQKLDYSIDSLKEIGEYIVENYTNETLMLDIQIWDAFAAYTGLVYEKNVPTAKWRVELDDEKNIYFGIPALRTKSNLNFYPKYEITAMIDRKRKDFLYAITKRHIELQILDIKIEFDIISGDDILIKEVVNNYNNTYKTDFEIIKFIHDEVVFARIKATKYKLSDIFDLGNQFGGYAQFKRQKGEIDW